MGRLPTFLVFWLIVLYSYSQQVYFTPAMVDTAVLGRMSYIDSSFHPAFEMANKGKAPLHFRFLLKWPGHEHVMDNDSALLEFIGKDPVTNLASILKTPYSGDNPYPVHITGEMGLPKKYRLVEFLEGFGGRLCGDYANLAYYILGRLGYKVQVVKTENHIFNNICSPDTHYWFTIDFDPCMPLLRYRNDIVSVIRDKNLMLSQGNFKDQVTPYSGASIPGALSQQMFWRTNLSSFSDSALKILPTYIVRNNIPANTSNEVILPPGAALRYVVDNRGVVLNTDLPAWSSLCRKITDSLNSVAWNSEMDPMDYLTIANEAFEKFCAQNPKDSGILFYARNYRVKWQNNFGSNVHIAIQNMNYQLLVLVIPPHTDTLWAGRDYRVPFWIEKSVINRKSIAGLSVVDSLNLNPELPPSHKWKVPGSQVQTLTMGHLYPSDDTTYIYLHFNSDIITLLTGAEYQVISGDLPEISISYTARKLPNSQLKNETPRGQSKGLQSK